MPSPWLVMSTSFSVERQAHQAREQSDDRHGRRQRFDDAVTQAGLEPVIDAAGFADLSAHVSSRRAALETAAADLRQRYDALVLRHGQQRTQLREVQEELDSLATRRSTVTPPACSSRWRRSGAGGRNRRRASHPRSLRSVTLITSHAAKDHMSSSTGSMTRSTSTPSDGQSVDDHRGSLLPPGPPLPKLIQGLGFGLARRQVLQKLRRRYGTVFTVHLPIYGRAVIISDPALAKELFTAPQDAQTNIDPNLGRVLGRESMFALNGPEHRRRRKLLTPPLHGKRIKGYETIVEEETRRELASWSEGQPFASMPSMTRITLNIIIRTVFGARDEELDTLRRVIPPMVEAGSAVVVTPELPVRVGRADPRTRFERYKKVYDDAIDTLIARGRRDDRLDEREDILAMMLQSTYDDGSAMTDEEIRDELTSLLVAGHETTATTLAWALERLSRNPGVLDELVAEVDAGGSEYRHATILEVQRSRPVIDIVGRHVLAPHLQLGPWRIPRGYNVMVAISLLHDDSVHFSRPERFDPTRFLGTTPPPSWLPFGGGTRRCIGAAFATMEMDVVLRTLLSMYEIIPTSERDERWHSRGVAFAPHREGRITVRRR